MPKKINLGKRPKCICKGCRNDAQFLGSYDKKGKPRFRKLCQDHHLEDLMESNGFSNLTDFLNSIHPYRKHRKLYCENEDGRLGFKCTSIIRIKAQLTVDHINSDHDDDRKRNLQTLCSNCHIYKTNVIDRKRKKKGSLNG